VNELSVDDSVQKTLRRLTIVFSEFETRLERVPVVAKIHRGTLTPADYCAFLMNLRQQVVDGGCWIARAASHVTADYFPLRSTFMRHAVTEHKDFQMLEANYVAMGGTLDEIRAGDKNIGSEAISAFMFHRASQPNPFDLLGAMFLIEGLGSTATRWGQIIKDHLELEDKQISFLLYHGENDMDHLAEFNAWLHQVQDIEGINDRIVRTAEIVSRLYVMQLEEIKLG
jgi:3-oxoacyl-[acyl-carrier-protein] synthase-3